MKFRFIFFYIVLIFISLGTFAQKKYYRDARYNSAIGIKFFPGSISIKHTLYSKNKFEGLIYNWKGIRAVGLFEIENRIK